MVLSQGKVVYSRGYGLANLEQRTPITPDTRFDIASVTKQFTALGILMLEADGKLSLNESVRKYVPELPAYADAIRLRDLLHQTSGLRDYIELFPLAGVAYEAVVGRADALSMICKQPGLNFPPGDTWSYSNSNYFLLALVLERVSGEPYDRFLGEHIFLPLGMTATSVMTRHGQSFADKATGYEAAPDSGFDDAYYHWETVGDGGIQTTLADLVKWDDNFRAPKVGTAAMIAMMESVAVLKDGSRSPYGMGLMARNYRGLRVFGHNGLTAGFVTDLERFPDQQFTVLVSCNCTCFPTNGIFARVADHYLAENFPPPPGLPPADSSTTWKEGLGTYFDPRSGNLRELTAKSEAPVLVRGGVPFPLRVSAPDRLSAGRGQIQLSLVRDSRGHVRFLEERIGGGQTLRLAAVRDSTSGANQDLAAWAGEYACQELNATWHVEVRDGRLSLRASGLNVEEEILSPLFADAFGIRAGILRFEQNAQGHVRGFRVWTRGVWGIRFQEVTRGGDRTASARPSRGA